MIHLTIHCCSVKKQKLLTEIDGRQKGNMRSDEEGGRVKSLKKYSDQWYLSREGSNEAVQAHRQS